MKYFIKKTSYIIILLILFAVILPVFLCLGYIGNGRKRKHVSGYDGNNQYGSYIIEGFDGDNGKNSGKDDEKEKPVFKLPSYYNSEQISSYFNSAIEVAKSQIKPAKKGPKGDRGEQGVQGPSGGTLVKTPGYIFNKVQNFGYVLDRIADDDVNSSVPYAHLSKENKNMSQSWSINSNNYIVNGTGTNKCLFGDKKTNLVSVKSCPDATDSQYQWFWNENNNGNGKIQWGADKTKCLMVSNNGNKSNKDTHGNFYIGIGECKDAKSDNCDTSDSFDCDKKRWWM